MKCPKYIVHPPSSLYEVTSPSIILLLTPNVAIALAFKWFMREILLFSSIVLSTRQLSFMPCKKKILIYEFEMKKSYNIQGYY